MRLKHYIIIFFLFFYSEYSFQLYAQNDSRYKNLMELYDYLTTDSSAVVTTVSDTIQSPDSVLYKISTPVTALPDSLTNVFAPDSILKIIIPEETVEEHIKKVINKLEIIPLDSILLQNNPLLMGLVLKPHPLVYSWNNNPDFKTLYFGNKKRTILSVPMVVDKNKTEEDIVNSVRNKALTYITVTSPELFTYRYENLPDPNSIKNNILNHKPIERVQFVDENILKNPNDNRLVISKVKLKYWRHKANSILQFSQNIVTNNWYQGGNSNIAVLGIVSGQLNYDNKKNIQWDNNAEWRLGFNSGDASALRVLNINDDVLKFNSKLGIKAGGNWFYSGSVDFSTQFFNNYKSSNSTELKTAFLTPVRLNVGVGFDYKYKKLFSLMLSPLSLKYIYIQQDIPNSPKLFGITQGEHELKQIGSSLKAQVSYSPVSEIQLDSKLSFYTNYQKVEIDWEIVGNFTVNRFLSTRISLNPRYDNTVILAAGDKAKLQFKELLSFGLSYKFLH